MKKNHKYIFVIGGVMSGVGKGVTASSIAKILKARGFKVNPLKIDPYLNVDAGTMNPIEHGEIFVLDSGLETDQDMGNYERFLDQSLPPENYMTSGMVYQYVIEKERALGYNGRCVDPVPYICEEIHRRIEASRRKTEADISVIEIGGTVGEFQNEMFIEAARILKLKNPNSVLFVLVSYLPTPHKIGEMKTKPTQYAVRSLNSYGVHPDIIVARSDRPLGQKCKEKIAFASNIPTEHIISAPDVESIYDIPLNFEKDGLSETILALLKLKPKTTNLKDWRQMVARGNQAKEIIRIGIVGKCFRTGDLVLSDVYISVLESLKHAATALGKKIKIDWLDSGDYEAGAAKPAQLKKRFQDLRQYQGLLVPGSFDERDLEGKIKIAQYARENKIPYFGLCGGMRLAVIEYARHIAGLKDAHTTEVNPKTNHPVIILGSKQTRLATEKSSSGMTRLGAYPSHLKKGTIAYDAYQTNKINERHRHRFEVNPDYVERLEKAGLVFSGQSPDSLLMEIVELPKSKHPFFVGVQFHPEFKSTPLNPHPLFQAFVKTASGRKI